MYDNCSFLIHCIHYNLTLLKTQLVSFKDAHSAADWYVVQLTKPSVQYSGNSKSTFQNNGQSCSTSEISTCLVFFQLLVRKYWTEEDWTALGLFGLWLCIKILAYHPQTTDLIRFTDCPTASTSHWSQLQQMKVSTAKITYEPSSTTSTNTLTWI